MKTSLIARYDIDQIKEIGQIKEILTAMREGRQVDFAVTIENYYVGLSIENKDQNKAMTFYLTTEEAIFLGKTLISMSETIKQTKE